MNKKLIYAFILILLLSLSAFGAYRFFIKNKKETKDLIKIKVQKMAIKKTVQAPGVVEPVNKVQIIPPTSGRIESVFVDEGHYITKGQRIALMSSTNRAALMDMMKDDEYKISAEEKKSLDEAYLPIPIFSPAAGQITKKNVVPGQTVSQQSVLFELSSDLIVRAQIDETDLKGLTIGMKVEISVDAFADKTYPAQLQALALESKIVNNINVYLANIQLTEKALELRSGMSANVEFILEQKSDVLALPAWIWEEKNGDLNKSNEAELVNGEKKSITFGISDGFFVEVIGLSEGDEIIAEPPKLDKKEKQQSGSPFMPKFKIKNKK